jgi:hypothetical protein
MRSSFNDYGPRLLRLTRRLGLASLLTGTSVVATQVALAQDHALATAAAILFYAVYLV